MRRVLFLLGIAVLLTAVAWAEEPDGPDLSVQAVKVVNFPNPQRVAGTVNVGNLPETLNVAGTVSVDNFPSPSTRFTLVGFTAATFRGDGGVFGFTQACQTEFAGSRMCTLEEALRTVDLPDLSIGTDNAWTDRGSVSISHTCDGWTKDAGSYRGLTVTKTGGYPTRMCNDALSVACCALE